jgi:uncharacterized membrane protein YfhO
VVIATNPAPAYLVFSEVWYPGWRAWVDGQEVPILKANFAFRAVPLPQAGEHVVAMRFEPQSVWAGLSITVITLLALAAYAAYAGLSRRSPQEAHEARR